MSTVHLVYTVPLPKNRILRKIDSYLRKGYFLVPPFHRWGILSKIDWPTPIHAPHSITFNLLKALEGKTNVKLYDWAENTTCNLQTGDILLFHPKPLFSENPFTRPSPSSVGWKTVKAYPNNEKFMIMPYNHDPRQILWLKPLLEYKISGFIAISGNYWMDTWSQSPLKEQLENVTSVSMAIDASQYPFVKKRFSPQGKRKFLYIGNTEYMKNTKELENIASKFLDFKGGYISRGEIKGWKKIADFADLTPEYMTKLADEYDIFMSTSTFDAQATTVLEQMCFGLPIACTPETGYTYPSIIKLDTKDTQFNCEQIQRIQDMSEEELFALAKKNREITEILHSWKLFTEKIINYIGL